MHILSQIWSNIRNHLFPTLEKVLPPLSEKQRKLVAILELIRIEKQLYQTLQQMLEELPTACNQGAKKDRKGYKYTWDGYKLHLDVDDNGIPLSALLTSASLHDSQACYKSQ